MRSFRHATFRQLSLKDLTHNASAMVMTHLPSHRPKILHRNVEGVTILKFKGKEILNDTN